MERPPLPPEAIAPAPMPPDPFKLPEEPSMFFEKPTFIAQPKPILANPKISPSSIPNPSPSISTNKSMEPGYPKYSSYLYNIPGYSAFQPVSYPGVVQPNQAPLLPSEPINTEYIPYPPKENLPEENIQEVQALPDPQPLPTPIELPKQQTDFEDHFTPEIIPAPKPDVSKAECKMSITSLTQGSGATVTIPSQIPAKIPAHIPSQIPVQTPVQIPSQIPAQIPTQIPAQISAQIPAQIPAQISTQIPSQVPTQIPSQLPLQIPNKDTKLKTNERFSLKTSIPISKIDLKCVNNPPDTVFQNSITKIVPVSQPFQSQKSDSGPRVEIQSNIVIKPPNETEVKEVKPNPPNNNSISSIIATDIINKNDGQFRKPDPKPEVSKDVKETTSSQTFAQTTSNQLTRPLFNPINADSNKVGFSNKAPDQINDQKNQIVFIQNKNSANPKMLLTIQQQNPQVLLQRTNFESKNLQAPSRLSNQSKKCKEELVSDNATTSKVVSLKRLHQENCDEDDFENLITENQIYGNKIVVKEKSQGTQQEQDLSNKVKIDKSNQNETKNVVLQPNFVYLSNVQFPANLMMIKNNSKVTQTTETNLKTNKTTPNEHKTIEITPPPSVEANVINASTKTQNVPVSKEIHVIKSGNNVLQTLSNKTTKNDIMFQTTNQKVIMNPQIVYQMPVIVDSDNIITQQPVSIELPKTAGATKKEFQKPFEQPKQNEKLFIACPYQMDSKLQPKIVITNIRPKKVEEMSSLDMYEKRRRIRRMKYLTNKDVKEQKTDTKKVQEKVEELDIITPEKMTVEIFKEFENTRVSLEDSNDESDSDYGEDELENYTAIIKEFEEYTDDTKGKIEFLSGFRLTTHKTYKEKQLDKQERIVLRDSVASACIAVGRLDRLTKDDEMYQPDSPPPFPEPLPQKTEDTKLSKLLELEYGVANQNKHLFFTQMKLKRVSSAYKESYEKAWNVIIRERKRRHQMCINAPAEYLRNVALDTNGQLQILTEIKKCVNENNNLIKKRLDCSTMESEGDSIKVLAEKNFSELNRLSVIADRSVKIFSGQETGKRDLNPGFDSENIQKSQEPKYPNIKIPSICNIISLKSSQEQTTVCTTAASTQATSMDEPESSAAGVEVYDEPNESNVQDIGCQAEEVLPWVGVEAIMKSFKEYDTARRKEIIDLHKRNTSLRVECAHVTRSASRESDRARALLAERQHLATEEAALTSSLKKIKDAIDAIMN